MIFAEARALDLRRRGFPGQFGALLQNPASVDGLAPGADHHLFTSEGVLLQPAAGAPLTVHRQRGATFAEKLEAAMETVASLGYEDVVIIGTDCPELSAADVAAAFDRLRDHALVLGPDQRGGCYLIGLRLEERCHLRGVRWQCDTDCRELTAHFGPARTFLLPARLDLDTVADVRLLARCSGRCAELARALLRAIDPRSLAAEPAARFVLALHRLRARWQLPPPLSRARQA